MSEDRFSVGDRVRVLPRVEGGNPRTPAYAKGHAGVITACHGVIVNPLDHHQPYPPLYSVTFRVADLPGPAGGPDLVVADLHEEWLEPSEG
jgi:hypothetical protein